MEKPDEFKNWIKQHIEDNPQEPPEAAWDQIAENLELETAWEGINQDLELDNLWNNIDNRLHVHEQLLWWERAGGIMATAIVALLVLMPVVWQLSPQPSAVAEQTQQEATTQTTASALDTEDSDHQPIFPNASDARTSQGIVATPGNLLKPKESQETRRQAAGTATDVPVLAKSKTTNRNKVKQTLSNAAEHQDQYLAGHPENGAFALNRPSGMAPDFVFADKGSVLNKITSLPELTTQEEEGIVPAKDRSALQSWRVGLGASARMSWLLNQKTYHAMEKSSLTTSLPAFRQSLSLLAEKQVSPKLAISTEFAVLSETGQRYREYMNGIYGTTDTRLRYSHLNVLFSYNPKGTASLGRAQKRWLAGISGGWLHRATQDGPLETNDLTDQYEQMTAGLIIGYEYSIPLSKKIWMQYGLRGHVDIFNAYAGTAQVPAEFRYTRNSFLDFNIGFKYELGKK